MATSMRATITLLAFSLSLCISGCSSESAPLPEAKPLQMSEGAESRIPFLEVGPHPVSPAVIFQLTESEKSGIRALLPGGQSASLPLVIFSHGNWSDADRYEPLLRFWVSHGYAVLAPTHLDGRSMARGIFNSLRFGQMGLIEERVKDIQDILDSLDAIEMELGQSFDRGRIALAGHSFGAFTVQQFAGAVASDEGRVSRAGDPRVKAVIAVSPPGPMFDVIHERSWLDMRGPVLVTTGTWDSNAQFWPDWRLHLMSFETARAGGLYALVVEGADHYLGNLICRPEREAAPQHEALRMVNAVTTQFLSAHLNADQSAQAFLDAGLLGEYTGGFARLQSR